MASQVQSFFAQGAQMFLVLAIAPAVAGVTRQVKARLTRRRGAPILQSYRDLLKLVRKDVVLAGNASWFFRSASYVIFGFTWV
ncbi:MAG: NADH-quinone oxidoreductase subunit H, partial [Rhodomicrobium sp.]|nr:NADH-quinone oxidoreductase subunit H [Rhodomicrobium sp.]